MDLLEINVKGWPEKYVRLVENYAEYVRTEAERNGTEAEKTAEELRPLPKWPGKPPEPEDIRRVAYGDE